MTNNYPNMCPRCEAPTSIIFTVSPIKGIWTVYHCTVCFFTWRNTEPDFITDPKKYSPKFKLTIQDIAHLTDMPVIPEHLAKETKKESNRA